MSKLSIVTPTYNRGKMLRRSFDSLMAQTCNQFEWIIVDDGSTDGTETIVSSFENQLFDVKYHKKKNGGKHTALNAAHAFIDGDYVLILDSDDYLVDTAVEQILNEWGKYRLMSEVGIVTFQKGINEHSPNCTVKDYNVPVDIMTYPRRRLRTTDACEVIRTSLFLEYPFPEFFGERFIAENALWSRVSFVSKCIYIDSVIYICEYLDGGLTRSGRPLRIANPHGGMFTSNLEMSSKNILKKRIKNAILYTCYGFFASMKFFEMLKNSSSKILVLICAPIGWITHLFWKYRYKGVK